MAALMNTVVPLVLTPYAVRSEYDYEAILWLSFATFVNVSEDMIGRFDPLHHRFSKHFASTVVSICHDILNILF